LSVAEVKKAEGKKRKEKKRKEKKKVHESTMILNFSSKFSPQKNHNHELSNRINTRDFAFI